jgi:hypothetical protein
MQKTAPISMPWLAGASLIFMDSAYAQSLSAAQIEALLNPTTLAGEGWAGFLNTGFLLNTLLTLILAAVLGAIIAYHPKHTAAADTLEELEAPKVYILYAVIGAIIGILVVEYGLVVGLVVFGIGGLIRFRTLLRSANLTGRVIFVTLIGLACGLNMPHVGVIATLFAFVLIFLLEARVTYRVDINGLERENIAASAAAYRSALERLGCRVLAEKKNPQKQRVTLLISGPKHVKRDDLAERVDSEINASLKGTVDWETD